MKINDFIKEIVSYFDSKQILTEEEESLLEQGRNLIETYTVILMDKNGEVDRTNVDEKSDELAWELFREFERNENYKITDGMYIVWE